MASPNDQRAREAEEGRQERRTPKYAERQLFRLAARMWKLHEEKGTTNPAKKKIERTLKEALAGYPQGPRAVAEITADLANPWSSRAQKARKIAQANDVPEAAIHQIFEKVRPPYQADSSNPLVYTLEQLQKPAQAVMSGIGEWSRQAEKEGGFNLGPLNIRVAVTDPGKVLAAVGEGFEMERHDTPGSIAKEAGKIRAKQGKSTEAFGLLPGTDLRKGEVIPYAGRPGAAAYDVGASVALDPTVWVTFGTSAAAKGAIRTASKMLATRTGANAAEVASRLSSGGVKALNADELAVVAEQAPELVRGLRGARGGVKIAGRSVPGTRLAPLTGPVKSKVWNRILDSAEEGNGFTRRLVDLERSVSPRGGIRQLERAGRLPKGSGYDVENLLAQYQSWRPKADILAQRAAKASEGLSERELDTIYQAMDVGGGRAAVEALPEKLRPAADEFSKIRDEWQVAERELGLLPSPENIALSRVKKVDRQYASKIEKAQRDLERLEKSRYRQSGKWANREGERQGAERATREAQEDAAVQQAVAREDALQRKAVNEASKEGRRAAVAEAKAARQAVRAAEKEAKAAARQLDDVERKGLAAEFHAAAEARVARANAALDEAAAAAEQADLVAARWMPNRPVKVPNRLDPKRAPIPPALSRKAGRVEALTERELTRLRVLENLKKSAGTRLSKLQQQRLADLRSIHPAIPDEQYMARYLSESGALQKARELEQTPAGLGKPLSPKLTNKRRARSEQTRFTPTGEILTKSDEQMFDTNALRSIVHRGVESERDQARVQFVQGLREIKDTEGQSLIREMDDALDEAIKTGKSRYERMDLPVIGEAADGTRIVEVKPVAVRKEILADMQRVVKVFREDASLARFAKDFDKWMQLWKSYATVPGPFAAGFVLRNAQGNFFNGGLLAGTNVTHFLDAGRIQKRMWKGRRETGDPFHYLSEADAKNVQDAIDNNVLDSGFYETDLDLEHAAVLRDIGNAGDVGQEAGVAQRAIAGGKKRAKKWSPLNPNNPLLEYGHKMNNAVERNARLATYLGARAKGLSAAESGRVARKYLFDYGDLSQFDRGMKKWSPFWTWTRKNTPLQLEHLFKEPGKYAAVQHFLDAIAREGQVHESEHIPQWQTDAGGIVLPGDEGDTPKVWVPDLPPFAAAEALKPLGDIVPVLKGEPEAVQNLVGDTVNALGLGGPGPGGLTKLAAELGLGREFFSRRQFYPGEQVETPTYLKPLEGLIGPQVPREVQYTLESLMPALNKVRGIFPTDEQDQDKRDRRLLSILTGQTIYPIGAPTRRGEVLRRLEDMRNAQIGLENDEGYVLPDIPRVYHKPPTGSKPRGYSLPDWAR